MVAGATGYALSQGLDDRDATNDALAAGELEPAQAEADRDSVSVERTQLGTRLGSAESDIVNLENNVRRLDGDLATSGIDLAGSRGELEGTIAALAETKGHLGETEASLQVAASEAADFRVSIVDLLGVIIDVGFLLDDTGRSCIVDALVQDVGLNQLMALISGATEARGGLNDPDVITFGIEIARAADGCGVSLSDYPGNPALGTYGDDPFFDDLYDRCVDGFGPSM